MHAELSVAQRAAVTSDARLIVVQGGPGTGKTEAALARVVRLVTALRQDPAWLLVLVLSEGHVGPYRLRLARALRAAGCPDLTIERTMACVTPAPAGADAVPGDESGAWASEAVERASAVAADLAPALGLARHLEEARDLLLDTMRIAARTGETGGSPGGEGDWLHRGASLVEESVRLAQVEALRRLRMLEGAPGWIGDLGRQLRRSGDVARRSRDLRSAVDRALRTTTGDRADLEQLRDWVDVAGIDLTEAARREEAAACARRKLWEAAQRLLSELAAPTLDAAGAGAKPGAGVLDGARHVVVDDAHELSSGAMGRLRRMMPRASLFLTGDQRAAGWPAGGETPFRALLREAGRAVVLLEAPRFGAGVGRFVNALGARLWPASEPGGYAPAAARLDSDPSAEAPVELWLVRRQMAVHPGGTQHPEPIAVARQREARALAAGVRRMRGAGRDGDAAVLVQDEGAGELARAALEAESLGAPVDVRSMEECRGLEWSTVLVGGLDEPVGGPAPRRAWVDAESGLAVVWPEDDSGRRIWPFSSLLLAQRAAARRDARARQRLFLAATRARTRLVLAGVSRERVAGGDSCVAPVEWLRRQVGVLELAGPALKCMGDARVGVRVIDEEPVSAPLPV